MSIMICDGGSATGSGLDYGFNLYDGNYEKDRDQAQKDKFDYAWDKLKLAPGMTLIDFGCGCGDWLDYVKSRGVEAVGINITEGQVEVCKRRGLDVIWTDWKNIASNKKLQARLYGFADCVTMWDTIEHYVPMKFRNNVEKQNEIYEFLFDTVKSCLKEGIVGRAWTSCLHIRSEKNVSFAQKFNNFILDKFHSGYYPEFESRQLSACAEKLGFEEVFQRNLTEDYYMTSVLSPEHFGRHKFDPTLWRMLILFVTLLFDPNWLPRFFWFFSESWMEQFDKDNVEEESPMQLLWILWEREMTGLHDASNSNPQQYETETSLLLK